MKKVAILGSAFNPPSKGHADVIKQALENHDEVWLIPSYSHAFGKKMMPYDLRVRMTELFSGDICAEKVKAISVEHQIKEEGPVYTWDLMNFLESISTGIVFTIIIGPDNAKNWGSFHKGDEIKEKWKLFVAEERVDIRSTMIRNHMVSGKNIEGLVTSSVATFLDKNKELCVVS